MNDSPGWASPGSSPADGERPGADAAQPSAPQPGAAPQPSAPQPSAPQPGSAPEPGGQKWSAEQPPPGQWSSPGADRPAARAQARSQQQPYPRPGAGWGGAGAYGHPGGWGGPPPAAKPGVIPLRPLGMGEILDGAVATMRTHWRSVLPITLVVAVVVQIASVIMQKYAYARLDISPDPEADLQTALNTLGGTMVIALANNFIQLVGTVLATAMLTMVFSRAVLGRASSIGEAWREARPRLLALAGLTLLLAVGAIAVFAVLVLPGALTENVPLIVLGVLAAFLLVVWLWIKFSLASPALMLEKTGVVQALGRSSKLVQGNWWRIFGITALTGLITGFVAAIIVYPMMLLGQVLFGDGLTGLAEGTGMDNWGVLITTAIGIVIGLTLTMPMQAGVTVLLYVDQRIRREALDLELARAAGIENYGGGSPAAPPATGPVTGG